LIAKKRLKSVDLCLRRCRPMPLHLVTIGGLLGAFGQKSPQEKAPKYALECHSSSACQTQREGV